MKRLLWPGIVFMLMGGVVILDITMITIASSDPSFAVDSDARTDATQWEARRAERAASDALGWQATVEVVGADHGGARVVVALTDRSGTVISDASVQATVYHHARASKRLRVDLARHADTYQGWLPPGRTGRWNVRITATRGTDRFVHAADVFITHHPGDEP